MLVLFRELERVAAASAAALAPPGRRSLRVLTGGSTALALAGALLLSPIGGFALDRAPLPRPNPNRTDEIDALLAKRARLAREQIGLREEICDRIEGRVNSTITYASTHCSPRPGRTKDSLSIVLVTDPPILSDEGTRSSWVMVGISAISQEFAESGSLEWDVATFTDQSLFESGEGYNVLIGDVVSLQQQATADQIDLDRLWAAIKPVLVFGSFE